MLRARIALAEDRPVEAVRPHAEGVCTTPDSITLTVPFGPTIIPHGDVRASGTSALSVRAENAAFNRRVAALPEGHRTPARRFLSAIDICEKEGLISRRAADVVRNHVIRLGERNLNAANTGNLQDLFVHTLVETKDPIRAFAQVIGDTMKIVPLPDDARLDPPIRDTRTGKVYDTAGALPLEPFTKMIVAHTAIGYADPEIRASAEEMIRAVAGDLGPKYERRALYGMILQSQHLPSSSFVLDRAHGMAPEIRKVAVRAGYSKEQAECMQRFFDVSADFDPKWRELFQKGGAPLGGYREWRDRYRAARAALPEELIYELETDTLTNFDAGTLASGKWIDAIVREDPKVSLDEIPARFAQIVRQYQVEWEELHGRPLEEFNEAVREALAPYGITFCPDSRAALVGANVSKETRALIEVQAERARLSVRR